MGKFKTLHKILSGGGIHKQENKLLLDIFNKDLHDEIHGGKLSKDEKDRRENQKFKKLMDKIIKKKEKEKEKESKKKIKKTKPLKFKEPKEKKIKEPKIKKLTLRQQGMKEKRGTTYIELTDEEKKEQEVLIEKYLKLLKDETNEQKIHRIELDIKISENLIKKGAPIRGINKISYYTKYVNLYNFFKDKERQENEKNLNVHDYFNEQYLKDENSRSLKYYQTDFIKNWSLSEQQLCILYYGVGTGKTRIIVNCAQQFANDYPDRKIYFVLPASLVLNTIAEFYGLNINPKKYITNTKGQMTEELQYNFISYQQLLLSEFDFEEHSLLIIDEAHNLRNITTKDVYEKVSARKHVSKDKLEGGNNIELIGNKLASKFIESNCNFLRSIFLTGTLFVNSEKDIEAIVSIGYKKLPLIYKNIDDYNRMISDVPSFKNYYNGLFSKYVVSEDPEEFANFPKVNYELIHIIDNTVRLSLFDRAKEEYDSYFGASRNQGFEAKNEWIIDFLNKRPNERTCIYTQFKNKGIEALHLYLNEKNIKFKFITGEEDARSKMKIVNEFINGEFNVLFFTLAIKEGISFKEVNNVIIYQPYWNYAIMEQVIARAIRTNSHAKKKDSTVNVKFLLALRNDSYESNKDWFTQYNNILNNNIKKFIFPIVETVNETKLKDESTQKDIVITKNEGIFKNDLNSRDIDIMNRMLIKQEEINAFEKKLSDNNILPFEKANDIDNNEFIQLCEIKLKEQIEAKGRPLTIKEQRQIKKNTHNEFYLKENNDTLNIFTKIENVTLKKGNQDLTETRAQKEFSYDNFKVYMNGKNKDNFNLSDFFKTFRVNSKELRDFQAYFTPMEECKKVVEYSGIKEDNRNSITILEPTAGIGNIISALVCNNNNAGTYKIDCNELHSIFYSVGSLLVSNLNIKWYNLNFYNYNSRTNYDYILGNPPFNVKFKTFEVKEVKPQKDPKTGEVTPGYTRKTEINTHWYDVHFVAKSYNLLNIGGVLCMIMSNRYDKSKIESFQVFKEQVEDLNELYESYTKILKSLKKEYETNKKPSLKIQIDEYQFILSKAINGKFYSFENVNNFVKERTKDDAEFTKEQEVNFGMVRIRLVKVKDFSIDFIKSRVSKIKKDIYDVEEDEENPKQKIKNIGYLIDANGNAIVKVEEKKRRKKLTQKELQELKSQYYNEKDVNKKKELLQNIKDYEAKLSSKNEKSKNKKSKNDI
jgi:superfamily II DNA or RNA helicase